MSKVIPFLALTTLLAGLPAPAAADDILTGLRTFFQKTARPDGSFRPGIDPDYEGMSDSAYSDLAPVTYAVILHTTFGWKLPDAEKTRQFLLARQQPDGAFVNVAGTVDPKSAQGRAYNTTMAIVALRALGSKPRHDPLPVFDVVLQADYKELPPYMTSFFPLAYLASDKPIPPEADRKIRALMVQTEDGYLHEHIASTFHAAHYYRLLGRPTPKADAIVKRVLRDQKPNGSWLINPPARDRHATFDGVFTLRHLGGDNPECRAAIARAAKWAASCQNPDGGFGHFPGSTSDADACFFHAGTMVMAGVLKPVEPPPKDGHLLGWGHLFPVPK
jgi:prenyltransferase beta subunit